MSIVLSKYSAQEDGFLLYKINWFIRDILYTPWIYIQKKKCRKKSLASNILVSIIWWVMDSVLLSIFQDMVVRWAMKHHHFSCSTTTLRGNSSHSEDIDQEWDIIHIEASRPWRSSIRVRSNIRIVLVMVELYDLMKFSGWRRGAGSSITSSWRSDSLPWAVSSMRSRSGWISLENTKWRLLDIRHSHERIFLRYYSSEEKCEW